MGKKKVPDVAAADVVDLVDDDDEAATSAPSAATLMSTLLLRVLKRIDLDSQMLDVTPHTFEGGGGALVGDRPVWRSVPR